jgi:hypothetical protein
MPDLTFRNWVRALAVVAVLLTAATYLLEQRAQRQYFALLEACTADYAALPAGQPEPPEWQARCDLNTPGSDIVLALRALDRTQLGLFAASIGCLAVLAVPTVIYLRRRRVPPAAAAPD